jgi:hypothetical protein
MFDGVQPLNKANLTSFSQLVCKILLKAKKKEMTNMNYEQKNIDNVFRYVEEKWDTEEFSYKEFFGIEDIEEFEKNGDIWG